MRCPRCGNEYCHIIEETEMKGYGLGKGCCGYIVFGPIGLLCGMCGMGEGKKSKKAYWICNECGKKFRAQQCRKVMVA